MTESEKEILRVILPFIIRAGKMSACVAANRARQNSARTRRALDAGCKAGFCEVVDKGRVYKGENVLYYAATPDGFSMLKMFDHNVNLDATSSLAGMASFKDSVGRVLGMTLYDREAAEILHLAKGVLAQDMGITP